MKFYLSLVVLLSVSASCFAELPHERSFEKSHEAASEFYGHYKRSAQASTRGDIASRNRTLQGLFGVYQKRFIIPFATTYSWAIPNEKALRAIQEVGPVVEIGAGTGYWAKLLGDLGVDIIAYDDFSQASMEGYEIQEKNYWTSVLPGNEEKVREHSDRALFLCWPSDLNQMASSALKLYKGSSVIYVGEDRGGATGDSLFFDLLERDFQLIQSIKIPNWPGYSDQLRIYVRGNEKSQKQENTSCGLQ